MSDRTCSVDGCNRIVIARGWCSPHWQRNKHHGTPTPDHLPQVAPAEQVPCAVDGCDRLAGHNKARMCDMHNHRLRVHGDPRYERIRPKTIGVKTCAIDGCAGLVKAMGWCNPHWKNYAKYGAPLRPARACVVCGTLYMPHGKMTTCSKVCSREIYRQYGQKYMAAKREIGPTRPPVPTFEAICYCCGTEFMANKRRWKYCSPECSALYKNKDNWVHMNKRRARMRNALVEVFDRREIFERDHWVCQLCGDLVDKTLQWPNIMAASLDHIIPIVRGGKHERKNAQTSHARCNFIKGAKLIA